MTMRTWRYGLVLGAALAACNGPEGVCVDESCDAAVPVTIVDDGGTAGALRAGSYRFVLDAGYASKEWSCALPADDCQLDYFTDFTDADEVGTLSVQARLGETGLAVQLLETRGKTWSGPAKFSLTVERDGVMVAAQTFEPMYEQLTGSDACVVCLTREGDPPVLHVPM